MTKLELMGTQGETLSHLPFCNKKSSIGRFFRYVVNSIGSFVFGDLIKIIIKMADTDVYLPQLKVEDIESKIELPPVPEGVYIPKDYVPIERDPNNRRGRPRKKP
jgi:hypothetical protein